MKARTWAADPAARSVGVLQVRKLVDGTAAFYYRYTAPDGERVRLPIGTAIDLRNARQIAAELSHRHQSGERDLRAEMEAEQREENVSARTPSVPPIRSAAIATADYVCPALRSTS